ncbi:MAG: NUDIX domain-containing protein [Burkholderiaceae bacterium]
MSGPPVDAAWLAALRADAQRPPRRARVPFFVAGQEAGTVEPEFLRPLSRAGWLQEARGGWELLGEPGPSLERLAVAMREAGMAHAWRDEQLAVNGPQGHRIGTIERGCVRPLGIPTLAVHLVGEAPDARVWAQLRALTKSNDPGLWDTLMGGMVSAADTLEKALERETWEEAGLRIAQLRDVRYGGHIVTRRPAGDASDAGYVVERIDWYRCVVPDGVAPVNQDGEVDEFRLMDRDELVAKLHAGTFTAEAALILCDC